MTEYIKNHLSEGLMSGLHAIRPQCNPPRKLNIIAPYKYSADAARPDADGVMDEASSSNITAKLIKGIVPEYPNTFAHCFSVFLSLGIEV